jgi:hypothetical protein
MALHSIQGLMGAGKSYVAVNKFLVDYLRESERHIYTNLPLNLEKFVAWVDPKPAKWPALRERIHILENKMVEAFDGNGQSLGEKHQLKEFWRFTQPNAVILLDETADVFNAQAWKERPEELTSYINHHRHYKDDLYFFCQDRDDIDVQIRRKIQYAWLVRNSLVENISNHPLMRGMKWPCQFFMVSCFSGPEVLGKNAAATVKVQPMHSFSVWPKAAGFATYESFSASQSLPGKMTAASGAKSGDYGRTVKSQWAAFFSRAPMFFAAAVAIVGVVAAVLYVGAGMMRGTATSVGVSAAGAVSAGSNALQNAGGATNEAQVTEAKETHEKSDTVERLVFVGPSYVRTSQRTYRRGHELSGRRISRIFADGVRFDGGDVETFDVLFPGR